MAGCPPKYKTPEELQEQIDGYFSACEEIGDIPLQSGLAYYLGFASRQSLYDYAKKDGFDHVIGRAKLKCEDDLNQAALKGEANPTIARLNLATNYGYSEKSQLEHTGNIATQFTIVGVDAEGNTDSPED